MAISPSSALPRYALAVLVVAVTTVVLYAFRETLDTPVVALLYLLPVGLSTALWGLGPGVLASFCTFLAFNYFFILPYYTFLVHASQDLLALIVFFVVAVVISQLVGRAKSSLAHAQAREREMTHLYELSAALAGHRLEESILRILAERLRETFQARLVEVMAHSASAINRCRVPPHAPLPSETPDHVVPLTTARGLLGEIRIWRKDPPLTAAEERLLRAFASQGALALERAALAQAETRAQVFEESDRLKSALLASVSHELRTPLATIKAAVTSLIGSEVEWDAPDRVDLLVAVNDEVDQLNRLVGNLLDMSRIEAGALKLQRGWNLLSEIVGSAIARLRRAAVHHHVVVDIPEDLPLVPVDYVLIEQVFINLLSNSFKYAPVETVIRVRARARDDATLHVSVSNQGPPVPDEHLDRIFDKFYRVTAADRVTGTGLGLSICKGIVEAHGGRIWAENLPQGFAFNFTLPLHREGAPPRPLPEEQEAL